MHRVEILGIMFHKYVYKTPLIASVKSHLGTFEKKVCALVVFALMKVQLEMIIIIIYSLTSVRTRDQKLMFSCF